jgi:hypothetical protein
LHIPRQQKLPPKPKSGARSDTLNMFSFQSKGEDDDDSDDDENAASDQRKKLGLTGPVSLCIFGIDLSPFGSI